MTVVKKWLRSTWLRYGLTVILLAGILWKVDPRQFWTAGRAVSLSNLIVAMALTVPFLLLKALRWHLLLRAGKCRATFTEAFVSLLGGMGVALLTPARLGEVTRAAYVSEPRKLRVGALVMVDKVYDVIVLALLSVAGAALLVSPLLALGLALFGAAGVYLALRPRDLRSAYKLARPLPLYTKVDKVLAGFAEFPGMVGLVCLLYTLGSFVVVLAQYWIILRAWNVGGLDVVVYCFPLVVLTNAVPLTIAGLGMREGAAILLLKHYGIAGQVAGTSAFLMFFMNTALPGLIGAAITPFFRPGPPAQLETDVQAAPVSGVGSSI
ncbi:MAG: putative rane protein [Chloroflexi bacterium]|nr:putative rane protein [Chloroflexota bacterium]